MKHSIKRIIVFSLIVLMLLPPTIISHAENEKAVMESLWKKRCEADAYEMLYPSRDFGEDQRFDPVFRGNWMGVLLFTRIGKDLTVLRSEFEDESGADPLYDQDWLFWENTPFVRDRSYSQDRYVWAYVYIPEFLPAINRCLTGKRVGYEIYGHEQIYPYLRELIKEYKITKEELKEACRLSRTNPDMVKPYFSAFTDEEFSEMKENGMLSCGLDKSYVLDALYVEDDRDCAALCSYPTAAIAGDTLIRQIDLMHDKISPEELLAKVGTEYQKKSVIQLLRHARNYTLTVVDGDYGSFERLSEMFNRFDETFKLAENETYRELSEREMPALKDGLDLTLLLLQSDGLSSWCSGQITEEQLAAEYPIVPRIVDIHGQAERFDESGNLYLPLRAEYGTAELLLGCLKNYFLEPDDLLIALFIDEYGALKEYEGKLFICAANNQGYGFYPVKNVYFGHVDDRMLRINCNRELFGKEDEMPAVAVFSAIKTKNGYRFASLCAGTYVNGSGNAWTTSASIAPPKTGARTRVYLGAAALCAALLAGGVSILRRRKRAFAV